MKICDDIKKQLASLELSKLESIEDPNLQAHVDQCSDCQAYYQSCKNINQSFEQLPEYDASDELVAQTLQRILDAKESQPKSNAKSHKSKFIVNPKWASGLAAGFVVVSLIGLMPEIAEYEYFSTTYNFIRGSSADSTSQDNSSDDGYAYEEQKVDEEAVYDSAPSVEKPRLKSLIGESKKTDVDPQSFVEMQLNLTNPSDGLATKSNELPDSRSDESSLVHFKKESTLGEADEMLVQGYGRAERLAVTGSRISRDQILANAPTTIGDEIHQQKIQQQLLDLLNESLDNQDFRGGGSVDDSRGLLGKIAQSDQDSVAPLDKNIMGKQKGKKERQIAIPSSPEEIFPDQEVSKNSLSTPNSAKQFLTDIQSLNNLTFQNPTGYWANTYVPGDSNIRWIENQLQNWDRSSINYSLENDFNIDSLVKQNHQPFDYPNASALAVYLQSDHKAIHGPTRMRVQVGLQASERQSGQRSAMNIGLVFDLKNKSILTPKMRAVLFALLKSKQPGDKISLTVTGWPGGMLIKPEDFRHGPIKILLNKMLSAEGESPDPMKPTYFDLKNALLKTSKWLQQNDDPTASLGSSVILLVTDEKIGDDLVEIESILHQNATKGITFSSVSLSGKTKREELDRLVLAGQGHNRVLQSEDDAQRVINEELFASSRAVARAIRLKIRLAKGVQLINVLDSYNLNEIQSQRVRDAEKSIDQRLSKNLGIVADRGENEEGIQIVIPSFFAGDTHVILLDVVVNNPGAVADVSVRYKDLLYLKNSIVREHLSIEAGEKPVGHLELNVFKNLLANRFSKAVKESSQLIRAGYVQQAIAKLNSIKQLYQGIRTEIPAWHDDNEMIADELLLSQSIQILSTNILANETQRLLIADSLYYTSWRKLISQNQ